MVCSGKTQAVIIVSPTGLPFFLLAASPLRCPMDEGGVSPEKRLAAAGFQPQNVEADDSIVFMLDPDLRIVYCNAAWDLFASQNNGVGLLRSAISGTAILDAIPEPLKSFYARRFAQVATTGSPWEHDYECSSPDRYRLFHMRVLPLSESHLLVENSLRFEEPHGPDRPSMTADPSLYFNKHGILTRCSHCRRTRRVGASGHQWDWVPEYVAKPPGAVSHGLCLNCRAFFYPEIRSR